MNIIIFGGICFMDYLTTTEIAKIWQISSRRVAILCEQDRIEGAIKKGENVVDSFRFS